MKYLTKKWLELYETSNIGAGLQEIKSIAQLEKTKFELLYKIDKEIYVECERYSVERYNQEIETLQNGRGIIRFEEDKAKKYFNAHFQQYLRLSRTLPQEILNQITNLRLFSLGYATKSVRKNVLEYCQKLKKEVEKIKEMAETETKEVTKLLMPSIDYWRYRDAPIINLEVNGKDLYIKLHGLPRLIIRDVKFLEREEKGIYIWNEGEYLSPWTFVVESELHFINNRYEVHFLLEDRNKIGETENWYLTVSGVNVEVEN